MFPTATSCPGNDIFHFFIGHLPTFCYKNWPLGCPQGGCPGPSHRPHPLGTPLSVGLLSRILLPLPVTVASGGCRFSKLKFIKNYLRTTITQNRLVNLSILSIEKEIAADIDLTSVVREFAEAKARRVKF